MNPLPLWAALPLLIGVIYVTYLYVKDNREAVKLFADGTMTKEDFDAKYTKPFWFMIDGAIIMSLGIDVIAQLIRLALQ